MRNIPESYFNQMQPGELEQLAEDTYTSPVVVEAAAKVTRTLEELKAALHAPTVEQRINIYVNTWLELNRQQANRAVCWNGQNYYMIDARNLLCMVEMTPSGTLEMHIDNRTIVLPKVIDEQGGSMALEIPFDDFQPLIGNQVAKTGVLEKYGFVRTTK